MRESRHAHHHHQMAEAQAASSAAGGGIAGAMSDNGPAIPGTSGTVSGLDEPDLSTFENKSGLAEDMKFLASMPELCDVTFLVGETREPVCAVKAVLAARSRYTSTRNHHTASL